MTRELRSGEIDGHSRRGGFTAVELLVACVIILVLIGFLLPAIDRPRVNSNRMKCAANLRNIATHAFIYSNQDIRSGGKFPRTYFDRSAPLDRTLTGNVRGTPSFPKPRPAADTQPAGPADAPVAGTNPSTGTRPSDAWPGGSPVGVNNVPAAFYLLMKATDLTPEVFNCPYTNATRAYQGEDVADYANWPAPYADFNSYSYACPYPTATAVAGGWKLDNSLGPDAPLASDLNPGDAPAGGPTRVAYNADAKAMRWGNSPNHAFAGQQVAYCDVHVEWQTTPFCGVQRPAVAYRDNIFASTAGGVDAAGKGGTVWAQPQDSADAVLLPTAKDSPDSAVARDTPDTVPPPTAKPVGLPPGAWVMLVPAAGAVGAIAWMIRNAVVRRRRQAAALMLEPKG